MSRGKFAWEREEVRFAQKRALLRDQLLSTKTGLLLMAVSLGLMMFLFLITPVVFFRGALDFVLLPVVLVLYIGIAVLGERILRVRQRSQAQEQQERAERDG